MELLVLFDSILSNGHIIFHFFLERWEFLFLIPEFDIFVGNILIFNLNDVLFIFIDNRKQLPFDLDIMLGHLGLTEKEHLFLLDQICIIALLPERISINSTFFFFIVEFQWFLMELSVRPGSIFVI